MKKTLISSSLLAAMALVGTAYAFTEAPQGEAGGGTLTFSGTIDNNTPAWTYEIADSLQFQGLDMNVSTGTVNGSVTEFELALNKSLCFKG